MKFSSRRSPVAKAVRVLEFYVPSFGAAMLSGTPSADDACCSATALHGSGLSSGAAMAAATSAGVMRAHFGARYTWPRRCCAGCRTAAADHLLLETMGCAAVGRSFVMSSNSTEAWDAQEWAVIELQHHPCRPGRQRAALLLEAGVVETAAATGTVSASFDEPPPYPSRSRHALPSRALFPRARGRDCVLTADCTGHVVPRHILVPWAHSPIWSRQDPNFVSLIQIASNER